MIADRIKNAHFYKGVGRGIETALDFLQDTDFVNISPGKYQFDDEIFYIIAEYKSKPFEEAKFEAHRKYIDLQYVVSGREAIGYRHISLLEEIVPYNEEKDIILYAGDPDMIKLEAGNFMLLFPEDGHKPGVSIVGSEAVKKVVVKIPV